MIKEIEKINKLQDTKVKYEISTYPGIKPNSYIIGSDGSLYSLLRNRFNSLRLDKDGYYQVKVVTDRPDGKRRQIPIHRIVAWEYCDGYDKSIGRDVVNHIDSDRTNNDYKNLEWVTPKENSIHAVKYGLAGISNKRKLTDEQVHMICKMLEEGKTVSEVFRRMTNLQLKKENPNFYSLIVGIKSKGFYKNISSMYNINS